jgi:hypothetical protein
MIIAIWNCISIPYELAFDPDVAKQSFWKVINSIIDLLFIIDIILTCRTTYFTSSGNEIMNPKMIFMNYLKGRFLVDLIASIPFELLVR